MKELLLTKRYAGGLVKAAVSEKALLEIRQNLESFSEIIKKNKALSVWLSSENISTSKRIALATELCNAASYHKLFLNFVSLLIKKGRIVYISQIVNSFHELADVEEGIVRGEIATAEKSVGDSVYKNIEGLLSKKLNKRVSLSVKEDKSLLGGVVLQLKDKTWDASFKRKLEEIKETLCQ